VLRESAGERSDALAPQPRLADLDCLLVSLREAGLRVALVRSGDLTDLPAGIDLALYRIVQEALTNTLRHAGPTSAEVTLVRSTHAVQVRVVDSGRGAAAALSGGGCAGHGLIGMRERVALYGGDLSAGPRSGGGYVVEATIPLVPARRVAPEPRPGVPGPSESRGEPARQVLPGRPGVPA
jgi:signal transduction histidine kinase